MQCSSTLVTALASTPSVVSWGRGWRLVNFAGESKDPQMLNKRGEMWNALKSWLNDGGSIDDQQTSDEIVAPEYKVKLDGKIVLESKRRDEAPRDTITKQGRCACPTFAFPVVKTKPKPTAPAPN